MRARRPRRQQTKIMRVRWRRSVQRARRREKRVVRGPLCVGGVYEAAVVEWIGLRGMLRAGGWSGEMGYSFGSVMEAVVEDMVILVLLFPVSSILHLRKDEMSGDMDRSRTGASMSLLAYE